MKPISVLTVYRVACPKFGHPGLSLDFYNNSLNTEFIDAVGMPGKIKTPFGSSNKFKTNSSFTIFAKKNPVQKLRF